MNNKTIYEINDACSLQYLLFHEGELTKTLNKVKPCLFNPNGKLFL